MATTNGCLVDSTNRGCKAIHLFGGASFMLLRDTMTRAPVVRFGSAKRASILSFSTSEAGFARLQDIKAAIAGKNLYIRFCCTTGDAMGMNMVPKGVQNELNSLQSDFPDMDVLGIFG